MSNYSQKMNDVIDYITAHGGNNQLRQSFAKHLELVLQAITVIEKYDNGFASNNSLKSAIEQVLPPDSILQVNIKEAERILASLYHSIEDAEKIIASIHETIKEIKSK